MLWLETKREIGQNLASIEIKEKNNGNNWQEKNIQNNSFYTHCYMIIKISELLTPL